MCREWSYRTFRSRKPRLGRYQPHQAGISFLVVGRAAERARRPGLRALPGVVSSAYMGSVVSVNVSPIRTIQRNDATITTGIYKMPVAGRVALQGVNFAGDDQADRTAHGGPIRAVYAYAAEYDWWSAERETDLAPGKFGKNLTLRGIDVTGAKIGERWRVGSAILHVTSPRVPCYKLAMTMDDSTFVKHFAQALRPGAYLGIERAGDVGAGDDVERLSRPDHDLTIGEMTRLYFFDRKHVRKMLVPELPKEWQQWVFEHSAEM